MCEIQSDYEDEALDTNIEKYVATAKAKVREKETTSKKKRLLVKKLVLKVTGKKKM